MKRMSFLLGAVLALLLSGCGPATFGAAGSHLTSEQEARRVDAWLRLQDSLTRVGTSALDAAETAMVAEINEKLKVEGSGK